MTVPPVPPVPSVPTTRTEAEAFLTWCGTHLGPGFHPDTSGSEYVHGPDQAPTFTPDQADRLDRAMDAVFGLVADPYAPEHYPPLPPLPTA